MTLLSTLFPTSAGSIGGINYISNPSAESGTTGWALYQGTGATPSVSGGTGGTPTLTFGALGSGFSGTYSSSGDFPLRGNGSFQLLKGSGSKQGEGVAYAFPIDRSDISKPLKISLDFEANSTYTASDLGVFVWDVTNATMITPSSVNLPAGSGKMECTFNATTSLSYRLIIHVQTVNSTGYALKFDNVSVSPNVLVQGAAVGDWQSWTPTGTWTTNTTYTGQYKREGDIAHFEVKVALAGAPTSSQLRINLPTGLTADTTKVLSTVSGHINIIGGGSVYDSTSEAYRAIVAYYDTGAVGCYRDRIDDTYDRIEGTLTQISPITFASGDFINLKWSLPISTWTSNTTLATSRVEYAYNTSTANSTDTTSFGYGPSGVQFGSYTGNINKTVSFQTPIQSSDLVILELSSNSGATWVEASQAALNIGPYTYQNGVDYGMCLGTTSAQTVVVNFGQYRFATGATFGSAGATWSGIAAGANMWRVRKSAGIGAGEVALATTTSAGYVDPYTQGGVVTSYTYTPTYTASTNTSSISNLAARYSRVGKMVYVTGRASVTTSAAGLSSMAVSLPIASNFTAATDADGSCGYYASNGTGAGAVSGDSGNDRVNLDFYVTNNAAGTIGFTFMYEVK